MAEHRPLPDAHRHREQPCTLGGTWCCSEGLGTPRLGGTGRAGQRNRALLKQLSQPLCPALAASSRSIQPQPRWLPHLWVLLMATSPPAPGWPQEGRTGRLSPPALP